MEVVFGREMTTCLALAAPVLLLTAIGQWERNSLTLSRWIEAGIPVAQVAKWAGNSTEVIFKHYCNVTQDYEMPVL
jgi:hypothetical protein